MIIKQIGLFTYHLPLNFPLRLKSHHLKSREGVIIRIRAGNNRIAFGEAAPLPGLHNESLEEVIQQLAQIQSTLTGIYIPKLTGISGFLNTLLPRNEWLPSVRFGLEMVLMNLYFQGNQEHDSPELLSARHQSVMVNLLAAGENADIIRTVKRGISDGYRAVKLKVGQKKTEEDIELVRTVSKLTAPAIRLRLDANRAWDLDQALSFARAIRNCPVDYIEEPLKNADLLPVFQKNTHLAVALDETLVEISAESVKWYDWIDTLVIKPAVIGSLEDTLAFVRMAGQTKKRIVISDSFHTGVGFSFLLRLAASLPEMIPMGFDTYQWLKEDILTEKILIIRGAIGVGEALFRSKEVKMSSLSEFSGSLALNESPGE